jgi:hypothetical protein
VSQERQDRPVGQVGREEPDQQEEQEVWDLRVSLVQQVLLEAQGELVLPEVLVEQEGRVVQEIKESLELQVHRVVAPVRSTT